MGQYLAIGIVTELDVGKSKVAQLGLDSVSLQRAMKDRLLFDPEIYDFAESEDRLTFSLKNEVLFPQLIPFLEQLYPRLYAEPSGYGPTLKTLEKMPPEEWLKWAKKEMDSCFQDDGYGMPEVLKEGNNRVRISVNSVLLILEGKILMEEWGPMFRFFKWTMIHSFPQFSLAHACRVYITG